LVDNGAGVVAYDYDPCADLAAGEQRPRSDALPSFLVGSRC